MSNEPFPDLLVVNFSVHGCRTWRHRKAEGARHPNLVWSGDGNPPHPAARARGHGHSDGTLYGSPCVGPDCVATATVHAGSSSSGRAASSDVLYVLDGVFEAA